MKMTASASASNSRITALKKDTANALHLDVSNLEDFDVSDKNPSLSNPSYTWTCTFTARAPISTVDFPNTNLWAIAIDEELSDPAFAAAYTADAGIVFAVTSVDAVPGDRIKFPTPAPSSTRNPISEPSHMPTSTPAPTLQVTTIQPTTADTVAVEVTMKMTASASASNSRITALKKDTANALHLDVSNLEDFDVSDKNPSLSNPSYTWTCTFTARAPISTVDFPNTNLWAIAIDEELSDPAFAAAYTADAGIVFAVTSVDALPGDRIKFPTPAPTHLPSHMPSINISPIPTAADTVPITAVLQITASAKASSDRKASLKATAAEQLGIPEAAISDFVVASTQSNNPFIYNWDCQFNAVGSLSDVNGGPYANSVAWAEGAEDELTGTGFIQEYASIAVDGSILLTSSANVEAGRYTETPTPQPTSLPTPSDSVAVEVSLDMTVASEGDLAPDIVIPALATTLGVNPLAISNYAYSSISRRLLGSVASESSYYSSGGIPMPRRLASYQVSFEVRESLTTGGFADASAFETSVQSTLETAASDGTLTDQIVANGGDSVEVPAQNVVVVAVTRAPTKQPSPSPPSVSPPTPVDPAPAPPSGGRNKKKDNVDSASSSIIIICAVLGFVVFGGGIGFLFYRYRQTSKAEAHANQFINENDFETENPNRVEMSATTAAQIREEDRFTDV